MFEPPPSVIAEVFARLPDRFRSKPIIRFGVQRESLLEGPSFDRADNLYCTDLPFGRVFRISPAGEFDLVTEYDGQPNGLKVHKDGRIFIADRKRGIVTLDPSTGAVETLCRGAFDEPFRGPNDLVFAGNGDLYFTDQGVYGLENPSGRVFVLRADGKLELLLRNIPGPNGLILTPDDRELFVAVTRDNSVWRVRLNIFPDGPLIRLGAFVRLSGGIGPDGMAMAADGGFAVAHFGFGTVWMFDAHGEPILRIRSPAGRSTTNLAFGGPDLRTLFITESDSGQILRAAVPLPGMAMFSHQ